MITNIPHGRKIPYKTWARCTDIFSEYITTGQDWLSKGSPRSGKLFESLCSAEMSYNQMLDSIIFAKWSTEQRDEWDRIGNGFS